MCYEVIVGNIGKVHDGDNAGCARLIYDVYVIRSLREAGRGADENVSLLCDGVPIAEYIGAYVKNSD